MTHSYVERLPAPELAGVVRTVWVQRTGATAYVQHHLPTGGVELHLPIGSDPRLVGPLTGPMVEVIAPHTTLVGVRFLPGAAPPFPEELDSLVDLRLDLKELWGGLADRLMDDAMAAPSPVEALDRVQAHLLRAYRSAGPGDPLVREAVRHLMPWHPVPVSAVADHLSISAPQLRRRCVRSLGVTPKALQRTLRLQGFLALAQAGAAPTGRRNCRGALGTGRRRRVRRPGPPHPRVRAADRADTARAAARRDRPLRVRPRPRGVVRALPRHARNVQSRPRRPDLASSRAGRDRRGAADSDLAGLRRSAPARERGVRRVRPALVLRCASETDVVRGLTFARENGLPVVPRGGGHCFAGRSSTEGLLLDLSPLAAVEVEEDGLARIGAGARLGRVYAELHRAGRTLPAGCGETVGIAGLTLGGGLGLLGRRYGLTSDRLVAARVVLADGRVVECDDAREPDLFWALRGAGGGQFGVVTSLTFATVPEPVTTRFELRWPSVRSPRRWSPPGRTGRRTRPTS